MLTGASKNEYSLMFVWGLPTESEDWAKAAKSKTQRFDRFVRILLSELHIQAAGDITPFTFQTNVSLYIFSSKKGLSEESVADINGVQAQLRWRHRLQGLVLLGCHVRTNGRAGLLHCPHALRHSPWDRRPSRSLLRGQSSSTPPRAVPGDWPPPSQWKLSPFSLFLSLSVSCFLSINFFVMFWFYLAVVDFLFLRRSIGCREKWGESKAMKVCDFLMVFC